MECGPERSSRGAAEKQSLDEWATVTVWRPNKAAFGLEGLDWAFGLGIMLFVRRCCLKLGIPVAASRAGHVALVRVAVLSPGIQRTPAPQVAFCAPGTVSTSQNGCFSSLSALF